MADLKKLAEEIVGLTLLEAQELKTILKDEYGIEPAAGGAVMMAGPAGGDAAGAAEEEKTEFDVVLKNAGAQKINVIKEVRAHHRSGPQGSQGPGRSRRQDQGRRRQGRSRRDQGQAGSSWRRGRAGLRVEGERFPKRKTSGILEFSLRMSREIRSPHKNWGLGPEKIRVQPSASWQGPPGEGCFPRRWHRDRDLPVGRQSD
jgi:hypothetical protein